MLSFESLLKKTYKLQKQVIQKHNLIFNNLPI